MKKLGNLFFDPKNGFFGTKKVEITLISRAISTSVTQRYKISKRNANPLTLVNTNIIFHFSAFFTVEIVPRLTGISDIGQHALRWNHLAGTDARTTTYYLLPTHYYLLLTTIAIR
mgnify:CR=1 FL=1